MRTHRTLQPPRAIERTFLRGTIHQIYALLGSPDSTKLSELVAADRLTVSPDGLKVATIAGVDDRLERIAHNFANMSSPRFQTFENGERVQTRILDVAVDRLLVWGLPVGSLIRGVYELKVGRPRLKLVRPFTSLHRVVRLPHGMFLLGIGTEDTEVAHVWTEHGVLPIEELATATAVSDGSFLFLEQIDGSSYRYRFGAKGFVDWFPVSPAAGEQLVSLAYVQNQYVLASRTETGSRLRVIGSANTLSFPLEETWSGEIERLWVSPSERSLAWLTRPDSSNPSHRALYLNGQLVHVGEFHMGQADLVWAPSGSMLGARIQTRSERGEEVQAIVTTETELICPPGMFVREFLIDTDGRIAATIMDDGEICTPDIYGRRFQSVPIAWNLSWTSEQGIGFNSVVESVVCRTVDETNLLRH